MGRDVYQQPTSGNQATKQPAAPCTVSAVESGHPLCIKLAIESSSLKPANQHAQSSETESHDCMRRWRQPTRCPTTFPSSLLFFTLLLQSRPNTPPRVISSQILVRRVSPGSSSRSSFETLSRSKRREVPILRGFRRSPSCNVRAKRHFNFSTAHSLRSLKTTIPGLFNHIIFLHSVRSAPSSTNTTRPPPNMFKRSFPSKDRAGKSVKPVKKTYREHTKMKLQQRLDSPPVGR